MFFNFSSSKFSLLSRDFPCFSMKRRSSSLTSSWFYFIILLPPWPPYPLFSSFNLSAYLREFSVWLAELMPGQIQVSITILTFSLARNESLRTIVSLLYLNGTCCPWDACPFYESSALTHSLRPRSDWLISAPSACLSLSLFWQSWALSEPARSTRRSLPQVFTPCS